MKVSNEAREAAEQFRRGYGGKYDRDVSNLAQAFAAFEKATLERVLKLGCPICGGDCSGANPPMMNCWMAAIRALGETT